MPGFEQLADGMTVLDALDDLQPGRVIPWSEISEHVIGRGFVKVFPLARVTGSDPADREHFDRVADRLLRDGVHFFGGDSFHAESMLSSDEGYGQRLAAAGIRPAPHRYVWRVRDVAVAYVRTAGDDPTLSLHVFPAEWQWPRLGSAKRDQSRRRTMAKQLADADPRWEWPKP